MNEPVNILFIEINDLATIAELARVPTIEQQRNNMGYLLIHQAQVDPTGLNWWSQCNYDHKDQTWENFKVHFHDAQKAIRRTGALTVKEALNQIEIVNLVQQGIQ